MRRRAPVLPHVVALTAVGAGSLLLAACASNRAGSGSSTTNTTTNTTTNAPISTTTQPAPTSTTSSNTTTTPSTGTSDLPVSGTYDNGPTGTPHNYMVVSASTTGSVTGTVNFVYQDGRTTTEFSFTGTAIDGTAQLQSQGGGPGDFDATYTATTMTLQGCAAYLSFANSNQCLFTLSGAG